MNKKTYNITILGAGYMGSAITFPLAANNHRINLWGTWLDDEIIKSCSTGYHPKLKKKLPDSVKLFYSAELKEAIKNADIIFMGVSSEGFIPVFEKLLNTAEKQYDFFSLTKGFVNQDGTVERISKKAEEMFEEKFKGGNFNWVSIGGPVKALEIIDYIPTISIYGTRNPKLKGIAGSLSTEDYKVITTKDITGLEICSAFKNVYATTMGIVDGIYMPVKEGMYHNFSSLIFNQSIREIFSAVKTAGGDTETVNNFAGTGDLYVTAQSGRNRLFGEYIGSGMDPKDVYLKMFKEGELAEGYHTLENACIWLKSNYPGALNKMPLFNITCNLMLGKGNPLKELKSLLKTY